VTAAERKKEVLSVERRFDVLGIGELNLDLILTGLKSMPETGREILAEDCRLVLGSSTAICTCGLARLGMRSAFCARIGKDRFGAQAKEALESYGIDVSGVIEDDVLATGLTVALNHGGDRALVTYLGCIDALQASDISDALLSSARHIHVGSFFLQSRLRPGLATLFERAHGFGTTTSLDAGWDDSGVWDYGLQEVLRYTDVFLPNESEAACITGFQDPVLAAEALARSVRVAVVKCGRDGAVSSSAGRTFRCAAVPGVVPVDTTGAGDSFNAGYLYGFLAGMTPDACLAYGNACGAVSVTRIGGATACATLDEAKALVAKD
jgi:sugar/nucleoside kinase (ribokinase family)